MAHTYETKKIERGIVLAKRDDGKYVVYSVSNSQVYSMMPGDMPRGSGTWFARNSNSGIDYVANGYSESYARRMFKKITADEANDYSFTEDGKLFS